MTIAIVSSPEPANPRLSPRKKPSPTCDATHSRNATCPHIRHLARGGDDAANPRRADTGAAMGLVEFSSKDGVRWRVWHVETPPSRAHLMDPQFRNGWLVFEREDGTERRRFNQVPDDWASLPNERLALLCQIAVPVVAPKNSPSGQQAVMARPEGEAR